MYCVECGFQNPEAANYCARCGTLLIPDEPAGQTTMSFPVPDEDVAGTHLVIRQGGGRAGERVPLRADRETIGRSPEASLFLDDVTVSRRHAQLEHAAGGGWTISDLGSLNGTYVNRNRVEKSHPLRDGDEVQVGKFKLTFLEH